MTRVVELIRGGHDAEARAAQLKEARPLASRLERLTNELVNRAEADVVADIEASGSAYRTSQTIVIGFALGATALALVLGRTISLSLIGPIREIDARLNEIAAGDFTRRVSIANRDELGALAVNINRTSAELGRLYRELETASRHKSDFLANMSHELRTPLNAVLGYAELLADGIYGELPERPKGVVERIQNNGKHLLALINDVLDLAKIEAGQLTLTLEDYSLPDVVRGVVTATEPLGRGQGPEIHRDDRRRHADGARRRAPRLAGAAEPRRQRRQIHRGGRGRNQGRGRGRPVSAERARHRAGDRRGRSGADLRRIPADRQRQHAQAGRHRARPRDLEADGRDAGRHDLGRIGSRPGVDVSRRLAGRGRAGAGGSGMTKRILVVEDTEDNRKIIRDLLTAAGYALIEATDGAEGVALAQKERPDLVLMDIQLPEIDGYEATRQIRAIPELAKVPIIAVTSYALSGDDAKARAAGCDDYVAKPFSPRQLLAKIRAFLP